MFSHSLFTVASVACMSQYYVFKYLHNIYTSDGHYRLISRILLSARWGKKEPLTRTKINHSCIQPTLSIPEQIDSFYGWNNIRLSAYFVGCIRIHFGQNREYIKPELYIAVRGLCQVSWNLFSSLLSGKRAHIKTHSETDGRAVIFYNMRQLMPTYTSALKFSTTNFMKLIVPRIIKIFSAIYITFSVIPCSE
jgi:hypothetical protein